MCWLFGQMCGVAYNSTVHTMAVEALLQRSIESGANVCSRLQDFCRAKIQQFHLAINIFKGKFNCPECFCWYRFSIEHVVEVLLLMMPKAQPWLAADIPTPSSGRHWLHPSRFQRRVSSLVLRLRQGRSIRKKCDSIKKCEQ